MFFLFYASVNAPTIQGFYKEQNKLWELFLANRRVSWVGVQWVATISKLAWNETDLFSVFLIWMCVPMTCYIDIKYIWICIRMFDCDGGRKQTGRERDFTQSPWNNITTSPTKLFLHFHQLQSSNVNITFSNSFKNIMLFQLLQKDDKHFLYHLLHK